MATDALDALDTDTLLHMADRCTPVADRADWVVTSADRWTDDGSAERYTRDELREFALEQCRALRITRAQLNRLRS